MCIHRCTQRRLEGYPDKLSGMVDPGEGVGEVLGVFMKEDFPVVLSAPVCCLNVQCLSLRCSEEGPAQGAGGVRDDGCEAGKEGSCTKMLLNWLFCSIS